MRAEEFHTAHEQGVSTMPAKKRAASAQREDSNKTPYVTVEPDSVESLEFQRAMGERLRKLRNSRKLSIGELAARAGVSVGIISQIERGQSNPSLKTLEALRQALGVSLWALLEKAQSRPVGDPGFVRRAEGRPLLVIGPHRLVKELLSPSSDHSLRFMTIVLPPKSLSVEVMQGAGEKGGMVLDGEVVLTVGDETALLKAGDSFQFSSDQFHQLSNETDVDAKVLWIVSMVSAAM